MTPTESPVPDQQTPARSSTGRVYGLVAGMLTAGLIGFGGGSALIPVVEKELVAKRQLLDEQTYLRHTVVANVTPGALPVKLGAAAGQTVSGPGLAVAGALAVAIPGTLGTLGILAASQAIGPSAVRLISHASVGITCFIIVLLVGYVWKVHAHARGRRLAVFAGITVLSALLCGSGPVVRVVLQLVGIHSTRSIPHLSALQVILVALAAVAFYSVLAGRSRHREPAPAPRFAGMRSVWWGTGAFATMVVVGVGVLGLVAGLRGLSVGGLLALSSITSFGGGEAYIGVAEGFFARSGIVDSTQFFTQLVPVANALPGPILVKVGAGVGFLFGGSGAAAWLAGLAAMLVTAGACCAVALPLLGLYDSLQHHPFMVNVGTYMLPVICGLLVQVSASMLEASESVGASAGVPATPLLWVSVVAVALMTVLHLRKLVPDMLLLAVCAVVSVAVLGL